MYWYWFYSNPTPVALINFLNLGSSPLMSIVSTWAIPEFPATKKKHNHSLFRHERDREMERQLVTQHITFLC
jgi:hypothetical protein